MPFQVITQPLFGTSDAAILPNSHDPRPEYILANTDTGESATIIPGFGGILRKLVLHRNASGQLADGKASGLFSVVEAPESPQALMAGETYASAILYPFASRIRHGIYAFEGVQYALPMNESQRHNAIHGLVYEQPFAVIGQAANDREARLTLRYTHTGDLDGYPFPFELTITYTLAANGLTLTYSALNNGSAASPATFGWHPYFTLRPFPHATEAGAIDSDPILDDMTLVLPAQSVIVLDDDMMPTGAVNPLATNTFTLKKWQVDAPFIANHTGSGSVETHLHAPKEDATLVVSQETGPGKLNYMIVFTPIRRDSIAIEPQTANVDAFNNGDGLAVLEPGDTLDGWIRVSLQ